MSEQDDILNVLPVRHGTAQGHSVENRMIGVCGGPESFRTQLRNNPDGSVTMLRTRGGRPEFSTVSGATKAATSERYWGMSSGAYELGSVSPGSEVSAVLQKTGAVFGNEVVAFQNPIKPLIKQSILGSGAESRYYTAIRKPGVALNIDKTSIYQHRPSSFSGLMRRMVQGQYGSGYADCKSGPRPIFASGEVDQRLALTNTSAETTGIIKYEQNYLLVKVSMSAGVLNVKAYPLSFPVGLRPADLAPLITEFAANQDWLKAIETLALANAETDMTKEIDLGSQPVPEGTSVAYGWNFSETTNKADIVIRHHAEGFGDIHLWTHLSLTFPSTGLLTYDCTTVDSIIGRMIAVRSPIWVSSDADAIAINAQESLVWPETTQNFPVYVYYIKDELKVVRWMWSSEERTFDLDAWLVDREESIWSDAIFGDGMVSGEAEQEFGVVAAHGFYIGGAAVLSQSTERRWEKNTTASTTISEPEVGTYGLGPVTATQIVIRMPKYTQYNPYTSPSGLAYPSTAPDPHPGGHYTWFSYKTSQLTHISERVEGGATGTFHTSALIIPYGDCAACYIGTRQVKEETVLVDTYTSLPYRSGAKEWQMNNVGTEAAPIWVVGEIWAKLELQLAADGIYGHTGDYTSSVVSTTEDRSSTTSVINFHGESTLTVGTVDADFFHATLLSPTLGYRVVSLSSSLFGDTLYSTGTLSDAEAVASNGYPNTIDAFIGAA